jgi:hypothetical protein
MADGSGPTERCRSEGTRRSRAQPGAGPFGYFLALEKVTRRRRNRSGVSQNPSAPPSTTGPPINPVSPTNPMTPNFSHKKPCSRAGFLLPHRTITTRRVAPATTTAAGKHPGRTPTA